MSNGAGKVPEVITRTLDGQMPYAKVGDGPKNLVILPGLSIRPVTPYAEAIAAQYGVLLDAGYTIHIFDYRTDAPDGYSISDAAKDLAARMKQLGIERADIAGASLGGMVALRLATDYPQLIDHLLLCSTCARIDDQLSCAVGEWIRLAKSKQERELLESFGALVYSEPVWDSGRDAIFAANANVTDEEFTRFVRMAKAILTHDCLNLLTRIDAKTLVVGSRGDRIVSPAAMVELADALQADRFLYDGSFGHAVYDEAPDYAKRLLDFCNE